jgi:hypothetical protein
LQKCNIAKGTIQILLELQKWIIAEGTIENTIRVAEM